MDLPRWRISRVSDPWSWEAVPPLPPLVRSEDGTPAEQATTVRIAWDETALHVRFDCVDLHAWGTWTRRDDPLWQEEAVEVFLAPGAADPVDYLEFEVSPRGVLFDARIHNPTSLRADLRADVAWDCPGIVWNAGSGGERQDWWAVLTLPWSGLLDSSEGPPPPVWRANFYRIERPRIERPRIERPEDGPVEFTAWSPTLVRPADFHKPARFGMLELATLSPSERSPTRPHPRPLSHRPPANRERGATTHTSQARAGQVSPLSRGKGGRWERGAGGVRSGGGRLAGERR